MNSVGIDTPGMRRLKVLCTLSLGACIPVLFGVIKELLFPYPWDSAGEQWANRIRLSAVLVVILVVIVVAYRVVRYSALPRLAMIVGMVLLVWMLALVGHFT